MNEKRKTLAKNYVFNVVYKIFNIAMPLITAPYLSRTVGAEGVGTYAYYYAIAHYFYILGKMGLNNYGAREIAVNKDNKNDRNYTFSSIYYQQILVTSIIFVIYILYCLSNIKKENIVPMILGLYTIGSLIDIDWLYTGLEKFSVIAVKNMIVKIISLIAIFVFVKGSDDINTYTLIMSLCMFFGFLTLWFGVNKEVTFVKVKLKDVFKHIKPNIILLFPVLASNVFHYMDKVMVGKMYNMTELGYYDNSEKIVYAINGFITAFTNVMMPRCSNLVANHNVEKCKKYINISMEFLFFVIILMGSVCFGLSKIIVPIVFGFSFFKSSILLRVLIVSLPFMIWSEVIRSMWIIPQKKDKIFLTALSIGAVVNLVFNYFLIPKYGAIGACIGTIVAEATVPIVQFIFLKKELSYKELLKNISLYILSGILVSLLIMYVSQYFSINIISMLISVLLGCLLYVLITIALIYILNKKKLNYIFSFIKNLKIKKEVIHE